MSAEPAQVQSSNPLQVLAVLGDRAFDKSPTSPFEPPAFDCMSSVSGCHTDEVQKALANGMETPLWDVHP